MVKTYILGKKSFLSKSLRKNLRNCQSISSDEIFENNLFEKNFKEKKFNLIVNYFYPTNLLNKIESYQKFYEMCFINISKIFDHLKAKNINKIIYSSSSSIYGSIEKKSVYKDPYNRKLYSSSKIAAEAFIQNYCSHNNINFVNARIFNMYGEGDNFSIISKLLQSNKKRVKILINNRGESIRDFIHVDDVSLIYKKLLSNKFVGTLDIGSGLGIKIKNLVKFIGKKNLNVKIKNEFINEEHSAIADTGKLSKIINLKNLKKVENFLKSRIKAKLFNPKIDRENFISSNSLENRIAGSIVYGAGFAGKQLAKSINYKLNQQVYCFVDDNKNKINRQIDGKKIISFDELKKLSKDFLIPHIIIAIPSLTLKKKEQIISKIIPLALNVSSLPGKDELTNNKKVNIQDVREIELSDIFNRNISKIKYKNLKEFIDKSVLITGGAGSIGSELCRQLINLKSKKIVLLDHDETALFNIAREVDEKKIKLIPILGSVTDSNFIKKIISKYKIDHIFHAAAYKHVEMLEYNVIKAVENNVFGTLSILRGLNGKVKTLTIISTDKAAQPKNILGLTKRLSEIIAENFFSINLNLKTKLSIVRFGNVFASQGSAIQLFCEQIKKGGPITVTNFRAKRYFMSIKEACNLVLQSSQLKNRNRIFLLKMGRSIKILDIAKRLINLFGYNENKKKIKIVETGLRKGEKLTEKLSISKRFFKTKHKDILITNEYKYSTISIFSLLKFIKKDIANFDEHKIVSRIKNFLKKEI